MSVVWYVSPSLISVDLSEAYHFTLSPFASNNGASSYSQRFLWAVITGTLGNGFIVYTAALVLPSQPFSFWAA